MKSRRMLTWGDLFLLVASAACIVAVDKSSNRAVDVVAGLLLVVYLPGAALVSAFGAGRSRASVFEREMWIIGASFGLSVAGGLVLNLTSGLTRTYWLVWVGGAVVVFLLLKLVLALLPSRSAKESVSDDATISASADVGKRRGSIWGFVRQSVLLLAAAATCVAAVVLSVRTNDATTRESFVQAWVLTRPAEDVTSTHVQLGLRNHFGVRRTFLVRVTIGNGAKEVVDVFSVPLANGASWTKVIKRKSGEAVESTVYDSSKPSAVLSRVYLATPVT